MEIIINDTPIDFKLEQEKNMGEVISNLMKYLDAQDMYIISFFINEKEYFLSQFDSIKDIDISHVDKLTLKTLLKHELVAESAENIIKYIQSVISFIQTKPEYSDEDIEKVQEGMNWCMEAQSRILELFKLSPDYFIDKNGRTLTQILAQLKDHLDNIYSLQLDENFKNDLLTIIVSFSEIIVKIVTYVFILIKQLSKDMKIKHFDSVMTDNDIILKNNLQILPQLADRFQNGDEQIGLNTIASFIEFITFYLNTILMASKNYLQSDDKLFQDIMKNVEGFTANLEELRQSLMNKEYSQGCTILETSVTQSINELLKNSGLLKEYIKNLDKK